MEGYPERPTSDRPEDLGFRRQRMVRWLGPRGLLSTAFRVVLAGIFGLYSDKREIEGVFPAEEESDFSSDREMWIDYVADLADGFRATYTMARVLASEELELEYEGEAHPTTRGKLLVMGGDQVYPFASEDQYRNRLTGPYTAALPCAPEGSEERHLFAIPGNHDWYDGLTTFLRRLCQQRPIGGWSTVQSRSYFAVKLPHRWWLWGIDIQFDFYIDWPQLRFFRKIAESKLAPGDRIMLCTAMPSWVHASLETVEEEKERATRNLQFFEQEIVRKHKANVMIALSGDLHHYSRYGATDGPQQRITSGGGGAFLYPTHQLRRELDWQDRDEGQPTRYLREATYPDQATSKRLRWGSLWAPFKNPTFGGLVAGFYLLLTWMMLFALRGPDLEATVKNADYLDFGWGLVRNPLSLLTALALVLGLVGFAKAKAPLQWVKKFSLGVPHGLAQLGLVVGTVWAASRVALDGIPYWLAMFALIGVGGWVLGSQLMGLYLLVTHVLGNTHANEAFSAQHIADYKSLLRMHIDENGVLTIYPIKVERVPKKWRFEPKGQPYDPWFEPVDRPILAELIERPVLVDPKT
jgi:hypothetical protein